MMINSASATNMIFTGITLYSFFGKCSVKIASSWISVSPIAARMVSQGRIPVTNGRIRPIAPSSSETPTKRTNSPERFFAQGIRSFARAVWNVFIIPAMRYMAARSPCAIHNIVFILTLLLRYVIIRLLLKQQMLSNLPPLPCQVNHQKSGSVG